ncbi:MAG TPA: hypothetical protein VKA67_12845, partial [Verrucomicrobiae bacterium]|nr:hypothetical protein [Verrucomicrobiae bacterium]
MIRLATLNQILACVSTISLVAPCIAAPAPTASRERAVQILDRELHKASGWVQIHAADALLDHGMTREVRAVFSPMSEHPPSACCIGVWRVMARAAAARQSRAGFVEKIRKVMLDAKATNRLEAAESLAKLGASIPSDRDALIQWLDTANEAIAPYPQWLLVLSSTGRQRATAEASLADLLNSDNPLARLRAAFALGRIKSLSSESFVKLCDRLKREP